MLLVQPAIPWSSDVLAGPLPAAAATSALASSHAGTGGNGIHTINGTGGTGGTGGADVVTGSPAAGPLAAVGGGDPASAVLWPALPVPGLDEPSGAWSWLSWDELVSPAAASAGVSAPSTGAPAATSMGESFGVAPDLGGIALLVGGLLVLAGWRHARR